MKEVKTFLFITFLLVTFFVSNVNAKEVSIGEIVEKFNSSNTVANYGQLLECDMGAAIDDSEPNVLAISTICGNENSIISYKLENNILSYEHLVDSNVITAFLLADSVGQLQGYDDGVLLDNFNAFSDEIFNYTVTEEGFEINQNDSYYEVKIDINKKVPLIDINKFYLKPADFDVIKELAEDGVYGNQSGKKAKLVYDVILGEDKSYIYIGENDEITESSYKSILSALEVMYNSDVVDYFQEIYPSFEEGIMITTGFEIEVDADVDLEEHPMFDGTKVVFVTIDNAYINDVYFRKEYIGETIERGFKTITLDFLQNQYNLGFFDSVSSSDAAFLYKYILEPLFISDNMELDENTAYYNVVNNKIVSGDKNNSVFKLVIKDDHLEILPTNPDTFKTTVSAIHENVNSVEYSECDFGHDHHRYGKYNVTINFIYGNKPLYEVLDGANQTVTNGELSFRFNIEYSKFLENGKVYIDNNLVNSSNYTSSEGSTIITFNNNYVKTLPASLHTLKITVDDGEVETTFTVANTTLNPQTGDNIMLYTSTLGLSIIGLLLAGLYLKKELFNN